MHFENKLFNSFKRIWTLKENGFYFKRSSADNELVNFKNETFGKDPGDNFTLICHVASLKLSFRVDTWSSSFHVILGNKLNVSIKERLSLLSFCLSFFPVFSLTCHTRISSTICYFILIFHTRNCIAGQISLSIPQWGLFILSRA